MVRIDISTSRHPTAVVIEVTGHIDVHTAPDLETAALHAVHDHTDGIIIDLTTTTFLDSTALGVFVGIDNQMRPTGRPFSLICPDPRLLKVFRISRLDTVWPIHATLEDALRAAKSSP